MKVCSYCGRENEDSAAGCTGCGTSEFQGVGEFNSPQAPPFSPVRELRAWLSRVRDESESESASAKALTAFEPVELQWRGWDAWKCVGMFLVFEVVLACFLIGLKMRFPGFRHWFRTGLGYLVLSSTYSVVYVLTTLYFARTETVASFLRAFGLRRPPSSYVWFGLMAALTLRVVGDAMIHWHWSRGVVATSLWGFYHAPGMEKYLYVAPLLLAPFVEEVYMRGFLYRAFRGSYSIATSIVLIIVLTALSHWGQVSRSWAAALGIGTLTVCQCWLRERGNLWDCILCHLVFNATAALAPVIFN